MMSGILSVRATQTLLLIAATVGMASDALAQQPTQAQTNAIRQSCRNDYMAHCSSVPTGGAPALHCLQQHASSLSAACQQAVSAIKAPAPAAAKAKAPPAKAQTAAAPAQTAAPATPAAQTKAPAAPAKAPAAQSKKAQLAAIRRACATDYRTHCHGIPPGGGAAIGCLKRNAMTLSAPCQHALSGVAAAVAAKKAAPAKAAAAKAAAAKAPAAAVAAPAAAPVVAEPAVAAAPVVVEPAPLLVSPREEMFILRTSCRRDYIQFCRGLRFGEGRVASCLHYNAANLSAPCQAALAALREGR